MLDTPRAVAADVVQADAARHVRRDTHARLSKVLGVLARQAAHAPLTADDINAVRNELDNLRSAHTSRFGW